MGNTVSAAEIAATQIVHPDVYEKIKDLPNNHPQIYGGAEIPPECPMHKPARSECPVNHDGVNPLNMVRYGVCEIIRCFN